MDEATLKRVLNFDEIEAVVWERTNNEADLNPGSDFGELWYTQLDMLLQDLLHDEILMVMARRLLVQKLHADDE